MCGNHNSSVADDDRSVIEQGDLEVEIDDE
jgi:hypothetical protein